MPPEECGICGATVALGDAAHVMLNAKSEEGVRDYYVCPTCFEKELVPHFPEPAGDGDEAGDEGEDVSSADDDGTRSEPATEDDDTEPDVTGGDPTDHESQADVTDPTTDPGR